MNPPGPSKERMLFVSPEFPFPAMSGGCLRTLSLLECLARRFRIHCVTFAQTPPDAHQLQMVSSLVDEVTVLPLEVHPRTPFRRYTRNFIRALRFVPPLVSRFAERPARLALTALLEQGWDWVWLEHLWLAPYVRNINGRARKVLDVHNIESEFYAQLRGASHNPLDLLGYYVFEQAARRIEQRYLECFDRVLAVSEKDRRSLERDCSPDKILMVPNAIALGPPPKIEEPSDCALYFAGRLDYYPNFEGVLWFHDRVWPLIRSHTPAVKWYVVGASPELLAQRMDPSDGHIVLAGPVAKTDVFLHSSSVAIVPLRLGGGTRFKILEAWAAGKSVVSTTKGAEGLLVRDGENICLADTPEEFSNAVLRLLQDQPLRTSIGRNGRETVEKHYSAEGLCRFLEESLFNRS